MLIDLCLPFRFFMISAINMRRDALRSALLPTGPSVKLSSMFQRSTNRAAVISPPAMLLQLSLCTVSRLLILLLPSISPLGLFILTAQQSSPFPRLNLSLISPTLYHLYLTVLLFSSSAADLFLIETCFSFSLACARLPQRAR